MSPSPRNPTGLGARVAIGAMWMVGMRWSVQVLGLVSTLILARLLVPEDFGIVALATAYVAIIEGLSALPMTQALVRFRDADRRWYDTAWTLGAMRGLAIALLMVASAAPVSAWMDEPRLVSVIFVLAVRSMLDGLVNPRFIDFDKEMEFARPMMLRVGTKVVAVAVTVGLAFALRSYWALIIGGLVATTIRIPATYALKPYLPRCTLSQTARLFSFSGWLSGAQIASTLNRQLDKFVIGGMLNTSLLGVFYVGRQIARLPTQEIVPPLRRAFYPGFTIIADDLGKLRTNALEACGILAAGALPLGVGLALVAEEFVTVVLSEKWLSVVPIIEIWSPVLALQAAVAVSDSVIMARLSTHLIFIRAVVMLVVRMSIIIFAVGRFGFPGLPYALATSGAIAIMLQLVLLRRVLGVRLHQPIAAAWRSLISVAAMAAAVLGAAELLTDAASPLVALLVKVLVGAAAYTIVHGIVWLAAGRPAGLEARLLSLWPMLSDRIRSRA